MAAIYNLSLNLKQLQNPKVMELVMQLERELEKTREPNPMEKVFLFLESELLGIIPKEILMQLLADKLTEMKLVAGVGRELIVIALEVLYNMIREALVPDLKKPSPMARRSSPASSSTPSGMLDLMGIIGSLSGAGCQPAPFPPTVNSPADIQVIRRFPPTLGKDKQPSKDGGEKIYPDPEPTTETVPAPTPAQPDLTALLSNLNDIAVSSGVPPLNSGDLGMILGAMTGAPGGAATMQDLGQGLGALVGTLAGLLGQMGQPPRS